VQSEGVEKNTANHTLQAMKAFFNFCVRRELLQENPTNKVEPFRIPKIPQHYLKHGEDIICLL
jgi:site-specific recombinase XerD